MLQSAITISMLLAVFPAIAQELEPRTYAVNPVGLNFLIAGYAYTDGSVSFDPAVPLTNAKLQNNSTVIAYARTLDVLGRSAKVDAILPYNWVSGTADYLGTPRARETSGPADPRFRFAINLIGGRAMSMADYARGSHDFALGASLQVSAPWGQYEADKLVNIGTNRWSYKPEVGLSQSWQSWVFELAAGATYFTANNDFMGGGRLSQDPLYSVQGHVIRTLPRGMWAAISGTYYTGGRTTTNGVTGNNLQTNTRTALTFAVPLDRKNSLKFTAGTGMYSRTGSDFDAIGIAWQHRWGAGL